MLIVLCTRHLGLIKHLLHVCQSLRRIYTSKEDIHIFKTATFCLLEEESDEDGHGDTEDAEHEERAPADGVDGMWCDLGNDEVE